MQEQTLDLTTVMKTVDLTYILTKVEVECNAGEMAFMVWYDGFYRIY